MAKAAHVQGATWLFWGPRRTNVEKRKNKRRIRKTKGWGEAEREGSREGKNDRENYFL